MVSGSLVAARPWEAHRAWNESAGSPQLEILEIRAEEFLVVATSARFDLRRTAKRARF